MPLSAIDDPGVRDEIVGRVDDIRDLGEGKFAVTVSLATATVGGDAGQLVNMLFGNTSIHDEVELHDAVIPAELSGRFGGPRHGLAGLRQRVGAPRRALTCSAIKPQGLPPARLAAIARRFADGGIDYVKDDHGLADQAYAPFAARLAAVAGALRGYKTRYVPSVTGDLDTMRRQIAAARDQGIDTVMVAPMIAGLSNFHRLVADHPEVAFFAHPALAGAARIAPPFHFGRLFRMLGADAVIFPNYGGRFGYSAQTCRQIARCALAPWAELRPCVPVPAGGMGRERVAEMLDFYGPDIMLLIGGALLDARDRLTEATAGFVAEVRARSIDENGSAA
ncbi:MAG: ribulose 1,5-bisphosphate carboxylase [Hyphomicrobiales bacterium]|nr:ribulose 1,5-bisphosphate carboxylase [Hyphomicrobiales bacterium]